MPDTATREEHEKWLREHTAQPSYEDSLIKLKMSLLDPRTKAAMLLLQFLNEKLPNVDSNQEKIRLYQLSSEMQCEFKLLLVKHGLAEVR